MYSELKKKFARVVEYSQGIVVSSKAIDEIFSTWAKNKNEFIQAWGGLEIELEIPLSLELTKEDKKKRKDEFIRDMEIFVPNDAKELCVRFLRSIPVDSFFDNRVELNEEDRNKLQGQIRVCNNSKLSKSLKVFFNEEHHAFTLHRMQTVLSRMLQDNKIKGRLVLSVNPLDFLSISENANNWRSCQALDGEYRAGILSQMLDQHTFIAYLKSEEECSLPNFPDDIPWNSKKWRTLFYWGKEQEVLIGAKQYPFSHEIMHQTAVSFITASLGLENYSLCPKGEQKDFVRKVMKDELESMHFNDCLFSSDREFNPFVLFGEDIAHDNHMIIGAPSPCVCCGDLNITMHASFQCDSCGGHIVCESCGEVGTMEDMCILEGEYVCPGCWDECAIYCEHCGDTFNHYRSNMIYDEETSLDYCEYCYEILLAERAEDDDKK